MTGGGGPICPGGADSSPPISIAAANGSSSISSLVGY